MLSSSLRFFLCDEQQQQQYLDIFAFTVIFYSLSTLLKVRRACIGFAIDLLGYLLLINRKISSSGKFENDLKQNLFFDFISFRLFLVPAADLPRAILKCVFLMATIYSLNVFIQMSAQSNPCARELLCMCVSFSIFSGKENGRNCTLSQFVPFRRMQCHALKKNFKCACT